MFLFVIGMVVRWRCFLVVSVKLEELLLALLDGQSYVIRGYHFKKGRSTWSSCWYGGLSKVVMVREMCYTVGGCGGCLKCKEEVKGLFFY